jgi:hypothetical protein
LDALLVRFNPYPRSDASLPAKAGLIAQATFVTQLLTPVLQGTQADSVTCPLWMRYGCAEVQTRIT